MHSTTVNVALPDLALLVQRALRRAGLSEENLAPVANGIVACERDGAKGHGVLRLDGLVNSLLTGWVDGRTRPQILNETDSMLAMDAMNGFAQVALASAQDRLVARARRTGVAMLLTRNSHHYSAIWPDIEPFANQGLIAFSCVSSKKRMAVWGGIRPVVGTNAMGFAAPRPGGDPLVWDQSSSVLSQGDVLLAHEEGREVAPGVGCTSEGRPTTSPADILNGGALLPFAGAKGASLAVMVEVLCGALAGAPFGFDDRSPNGSATTSLGGQFLLVIDPKHSASDFLKKMDRLFEALADAGTQRFPGDRRYAARRKSLLAGVTLEEREYASLLALAGGSSD